MEKTLSKLSGIVLLNKTDGISSQAAVTRVKRLFGVDKAGHTGTLDPLATGVLPVLIGRAVKASEFMLTADKHYTATLLLGVTTDTEDVTGRILTECHALPTEEEVLRAVLSMKGTSMQTPPMYSAIKVGGAKLYELARRGEVVEREAREITVHDISAERISDAEYTVHVHCSKGTYIRTLLSDIGARLGCGATMKTLMRTEASGYGIERAHTLDELSAMSEEELEGIVIPTEDVFMKYEAVVLEPFFSRLARAGQEIYQRKIGRSLALGTLVRLSDKDGFFALGEVREFGDGTAIKPIRQFGKQ